ncbi:LPS export ABC transporter periplasmic protein LptC [Porphyromonas pogonae]|uniref:LPS export ABC transporter periplasmic protein LptC n=1 Tax=Porphyromonas pogonae TaxID=867595 RepID=UPI002E78BE4E|nr:LPS export ABC transporter periplasmic protein LptC [Porphyromonas pogonae]
MDNESVPRTEIDNKCDSSDRIKKDVVRAYHFCLNPNYLRVGGILALFILILWAQFGCSQKKPGLANHGIKLDTMYMMKTENVNVLLSDSGVIKYRMITKEWRIYDNPTNKKWYFPRGVYVENIDTLKRMKAKISADTAYYKLDDKLWELIGHVHMKALNGTQLYSPHLFWDEANRRIYSNDSVYFTTGDKVSRGTSFQARDDLSQYSVFNNSGTLDFDENKLDSVGPPPQGMHQDSTFSGSASRPHNAPVPDSIKAKTRPAPAAGPSVTPPIGSHADKQPVPKPSKPLK